MALNSSQNEIIAMRRNKVAELRLSGGSERAIWEALAYGNRREGGLGRLVNPKTGEPFSLATIHLDIKALEKEWRESAAQATDVHQARQLAEIQHIKVMAFNSRNPALALRAIDSEIKLLGTAAPVKLDISMPVFQEWLATMLSVGQNPDKVLQRMTERARQEHVH